MTQEDKELLLKDLSARMPYGVKVLHFGTIKELLGIIPSTENVMVGYDINDYEDSVIEDIKPYLRPMSEITNLISAQEITQLSGIDLIERYNANHIDYHTDDEGKTLIEKGLALEAPEGMYNNH
jgi:hypothetical protein